MKTATLKARQVKQEDSGYFITEVTTTGTIAGLSKAETEMIGRMMVQTAGMLFVNGEQNATAIARKRVMRAPYIEFLLNHFRMDDETLAELDD